MIVHFEPTGDIRGFRNQLEWFENNPKIKGIIILNCEGNNYEPAVINPLVRSLSNPVMGGSFPGIIYDKNKYSKGSVFIGTDIQLQTSVIPNLSKSENNIDERVKLISKTMKPGNTQLIFVDGLTNGIEQLIESLFKANHFDSYYIGGGAGTVNMTKKPCIFTNEGLLADAAVVGSLSSSIGIGVKHGLTSIAGPFKVTSSEKNIIKTIEYFPAFDFYKSALETFKNIRVYRANFLEIANDYPFGLEKPTTEKIVRDLIAVNENKDLICVGEIPQGSFINILHGNPQKLIEASKEALSIGKCQSSGTSHCFTFLIESFSRTLLLNEYSNSELDAIQDPDTLLIGVLSIGEIANSGLDYIEFYNKATVFGCF
jgi:hypothetical protein